MNEQQTAQLQLKYAGFWVRFWAYLLDVLVVSAIGTIIVRPVLSLLNISVSKGWWFVFTPYRVTIFIVAFLYFVLMTKMLGQTLGKMVVGIKVQSKDGEPLRWKDVLFREVVGRFISKMTWLPYLTVIFLPRKEAVHDLIADTVVIHEYVYEEPYTSRYREPQLPQVVEQ